MKRINVINCKCAYANVTLLREKREGDSISDTFMASYRKCSMSFSAANILFTSCFLLIFPKCLSQKNESHNSHPGGHLVTEILDKFDKYQLPRTNKTESKVHFINTTETIRNVYDVSEQDSSFKVNYNLELKWYDKRFELQGISAGFICLLGFLLASSEIQASAKPQFAFISHQQKG